MYSDGSALQRLSRDECLTLLASVPVGRIIYTRRALPRWNWSNFALDHGDIVIRTDRGGKLAAAARGAVSRSRRTSSTRPAGPAGASPPSARPAR